MWGNWVLCFMNFKAQCLTWKCSPEKYVEIWEEWGSPRIEVLPVVSCRWKILLISLKRDGQLGNTTRKGMHTHTVDPWTMWIWTAWANFFQYVVDFLSIYSQLSISSGFRFMDSINSRWKTVFLINSWESTDGKQWLYDYAMPLYIKDLSIYWVWYPWGVFKTIPLGYWGTTEVLGA